MIGKTVLHYKIIEKIGEGGMGVVYKAEDTKLKRDVALKFLPTNALQGQAEKDRFIREAQAAASFSHANIAHIYAIEEFEGQMFIVMEFIEGQSLAEIVGANGHSPLPLEKSINYANQISAGLQAAQEKGITHRDIKSANIMVTNKNVVKIMDFGLAKLAYRTKMTMEGSTLGTAAYMSPEQARGHTVDHRSDIWSLGVVLYEMISGQLPFKGDYEQAVIYSILNDEPEPLTALRSGLPIALDSIITKALSKDPDTRYQHVDELPADLKAIDKTPSRVSRIGTTTVQTKNPLFSRRWISTVPWILVLVLAIIGVLAIWGNLGDFERTSQTVTRFTIDLPEGAQLKTDSKIALSPDGRRIAYVAIRDGISQLYLHQFDQFEAKAISGTEGARADPFFSPDGEWLAFFTGRILKKVALTSGVIVTLCDTNPVCSGGLWGVDDNIYFRFNPVTGLMRVSADGRIFAIADENPETGIDIWLIDKTGQQKPKPWLVTRFTETGAMFSPDGRWIAYQSDESGQFEIYVQAFPSPGRKYRISTNGGTEPLWSRDGSELFYRSGNAMMALSVETKETFKAGQPVVLFQGSYLADRIVANYDISPDGQRFLMIQDNPLTQIKVVLNWVEELKAKLSTN